MSENKVVINASGEKILFGKNIINLEDQTSETFKTNSLLALAEYLKDKNCTIFADGNKIEVYDTPNLQAIFYNLHPIALCDLKGSAQIQILRQSNKRPMQLQEFIDFLRSIKKYAATDTLQLMDALNDLRIKKIIDIQHSTDNRGNFDLHIKADKGASDYKFPESISFIIPLFDIQDGLQIKLSFDLYFNWSMEEATAKLIFKLINYDFDVDVDTEVRKVTKQVLTNENWKLNYGLFVINKKTNEHLFKESNIQL